MPATFLVIVLKTTRKIKEEIGGRKEKRNKKPAIEADWGTGVNLGQ